MIQWTDKSDSRGRFFDGGDFSGSTQEAINDLFSCLLRLVVQDNAARKFDLLFFEANCDTGRLIAATSNSTLHRRGHGDGCSLRVQELESFWYELLKVHPTDKAFSDKVNHRVRDLGLAFRERFIQDIDLLKQSCISNGFTYRAFGIDAGISVYSEEFYLQQFVGKLIFQKIVVSIADRPEVLPGDGPVVMRRLSGQVGGANPFTFFLDGDTDGNYLRLVSL